MSSALLERASAQQARLSVIDCDVHHALRSPKDLYPYLSARWREHLATYGSRRPTPFTGSSPFFKSAPALSRKDTWPPNGGSPGSDLAFLQDLYRRVNSEGHTLAAVTCPACHEHFSVDLAGGRLGES